MNGCTNPAAANYDPAATIDDNSCVYLEKYNGTCYAFQDVNQEQIMDESFTLSFSLNQGDWVFFHDYVPDFYFSDREHLYSLKDRKIYRHNEGAPGVYYDVAPKSFFIDATFPAAQEFILNSIQWITEVFLGENIEEFSTLTHITVWNATQCTGRITLNQVFQELTYETRKLQGFWSFDDFRNLVKEGGAGFLNDLFNNFSVKTDAIDAQKPWFDQELIRDNWVVIRFEFDNTSGKRCILHGVDINADKSYR